ncbi:fatty-acyl CoA reductase 2, partial [Danaus plexippus plexippus]
ILRAADVGGGAGSRLSAGRQLGRIHIARFVGRSSKHLLSH